MSPEFDSKSLPSAIKKLFELNNYEVEESLNVHGAEIDLLARRKSDPFSVPIYVEVTIEYVDNDKYGKDVGKFALIREKEPDAQRLIVSSKGFSNPVKERAKESRIQTLTYEQLFSRFEKFESYINKCLEDSDLAQELQHLDSIYEEPNFEDEQGKDVATEFLTRWRDNTKPDEKWLVITGEYGTGKTALTKILLYRWLTEYKKNPSIPLPFRIELREFVRQFDARGLLHHFLDTNSLGHIPIEFIYSLLHSGRIILLLDGYDEMAQYLHVRERRACLSALAELSSGGAKGLLTSRPNYFTETEEFHVFEILYSSIDQQKYYLTKKDRELIERETQVDELLGQFLDQHERILKDLTPEQTESLIARALGSDPHGKDVVLNILKRIFRSVEKGESVSLSGKPVIISYLLQVVEDLKEGGVNAPSEHEELSEWDVYKLIIDQLMLRDLRRSPEVGPEDRRKFLSRLSIKLSQKEHAVIDEDDFKDIVSKEFQRELRRHPADQRHQIIERYFADLRSSATLTRSNDIERPGWTFSHNSLREYLVAEHFVRELIGGRVVKDHVPISDAMRLFVTSCGRQLRQEFFTNLQRIWNNRYGEDAIGQVFTLLWDAIIRLYSDKDDPTRACLSAICSGPIDLSKIEINRISFSTPMRPANLQGAIFSGATMLTVGFENTNAEHADFSSSFLDGVLFSEASLDNANFSSAFIVDADFSGASVQGSDFSGIEQNDISIVVYREDAIGKKAHLEGVEALGYLKYNGAQTNKIPTYFELKHHPKFGIVEKIVEKLSENTIRQRRGLEQRGAARQDIQFSRDFRTHIENGQLIITRKNRKDLVEVTEKGRDIFGEFLEKSDIPEYIEKFLRENRK